MQSLCLRCSIAITYFYVHYLVFLVFLGELKRNNLRSTFLQKKLTNVVIYQKDWYSVTHNSVVHLYIRRAIFSIASERTNLTFRLGERRRTESLLVIFFTYLARKTYFLSEVKLGDFSKVYHLLFYLILKKCGSLLFSIFFFFVKDVRKHSYQIINVTNYIPI